MEELVAELGAAFLCAELGISSAPRPDHASYIDHWLKVLKNEKSAVFVAARAATQASAFLSAQGRARTRDGEEEVPKEEAYQ
jgi:antirestriction protein ArdC